MGVQNIDKHYLLPGAIFMHSRSHVVDTVLGSCVSVCLFDTKVKIGGINHFMLPFWNGQGLASPKYGNIAMEKLIERMIGLGCTKRNLIAKVFGGANQMQGSHGVGMRNVVIAREYLEEVGIPVVAQNVGGSSGRKIRFNTGNGEVLMKFLQKVAI